MSYFHPNGTTQFAIALPVTGTVTDFIEAITAAIAERQGAGDMISAGSLSLLLGCLRYPATSPIYYTQEEKAG